ncbi:DUF4174 domain-containing protein [Jannaschia marina]|uniref:DUF4174 domain-containing protein n=1 Tax=Jannaschia marina TaxID=2741674 RepID=UPI0015CCA7E2|nr:DUF4174 domain-containing protein [Jannaschia marina]
MHALLTSSLLSLALTLPAVAADTPSLEEAWRADPAQVFDASEIDIAELLWVARPVVVFANTPRDPSFEEQMEELQADLPELIARDVILVTDTDPSVESDLRQQLRPRGFMLVLIGKDGEVELRKPLPWTVRELSRSIDKMPLRQREIGRGR